jgi:hypothetical protein
MTTNSRRLFTIAVALLLSAIVAVNANAQCCGATTAYYAPSAYTSYYAPYTSYYSGAYTSYYTPYTSYYSPYSSYYAPTYSTYYAGGWYPGYWMNRIRTRLWGSPTTYVAAYPATYAAAYAPSCSSCQSGYVTSYAPACPTCSSCSACASPCSACSTCAPCSSCSTCTASYAPCTTCASPCGCESCSACESCSGCSACSAPAVTQASYQPQSSGGCASCGTQASNTQQNVVTPPPQQMEPRPTYDASQQNSPQSTITNRPVDTPQAPQQTHPEYDVKKNDSSTYLEAPKLFNPRDRTAQRSIAPVRTALYQQPASYHEISASRTTISAEQAERDAAGWESVSK